MLVSKKRKPKVAIVLPAFNEERVISSVLTDLSKAIHRYRAKYNLKIVVVNDGSTDSTSSKARKLPKVYVIDHIINSGAGAATRTGLHYTKILDCDYALTMDSDGQHAAKDVCLLLDHIADKEADLIIGSRVKNSDGNMPRYKKVGNFGLGLITFMLLGVYSSDSQSGLRAFNRKALHTIDFHSNDYAFCSEIIWKAHQAKLQIKEVSVKAIYTEYSISRGQKSFSGAINIIGQLAKRRFLKLLNG